MLKRDFASTTRQIGSPDIMINQPHFMKDKDWGSIIGGGLKEYNRQQDIDALTTALQAEDEEQIADAWAKVDPMGYAQRLDQMKQARLDREQQLEDDELKHQKALELANLRNKTISSGGQNRGEFMSLLALKETLDPNNPEDTAKIKLIDDRLNYLSQNPEQIGKISTSRETGKTQAKDVDMFRSSLSKMPEIVSTVQYLGGDLSSGATYTGFGQAVDSFIKQTTGLSTKGSKDRAEYVAVVNNQILPLLRDTFGAQFTEREGRDLRETLGNPDSTPEEKRAVLKAFLDRKVKDVIGMARKLEMSGLNINDLTQDQYQEIMKDYLEPTKAQQMQQGLSQIVPQEEQMSKYDFSKSQEKKELKLSDGNTVRIRRKE